MISRCGQTRAGGGGGGLWLITYRKSATNAQVCGPEQGERWRRDLFSHGRSPEKRIFIWC